MVNRLTLDRVAPLILLAAFLSILLFAWPQHQRLSERQQLLGVVSLGREVAQGVKHHYRTALQWPATLADLGMKRPDPLPPLVRSLTLGAEGLVTIELDPAHYPGGEVRFEFMQYDNTIGWRCRTVAIDPRLLPEMCRSDDLEESG